MSGIPGYVTLREMAEAAQVHPASLRRAIARGAIKGAVKEGKTWFVPTAEAQKYPVGGYPRGQYERTGKKRKIAVNG